ncbi:hypothetical protein MKW98_031998 [Papaver atlanticum]|uniref:Uncharacterized protein n=1 Tax=Papaver atlanticum TaxID=357466 RepID=A0AAD4XD30_9MAGN|nr:hypothetical protein MKW98_031998 [Papaver atlanticum]
MLTSEGAALGHLPTYVPRIKKQFYFPDLALINGVINHLYNYILKKLNDRADREHRCCTFVYTTTSCFFLGKFKSHWFSARVVPANFPKIQLLDEIPGSWIILKWFVILIIFRKKLNLLGRSC